MYTFSCIHGPLRLLFKSHCIFEHEAEKNILNLYGNEADFLGFFQKLVPHVSLTLPFELFRFWLQILVIEKRLANSASQGVADSPTRQVGELPIL